MRGGKHETIRSLLESKKLPPESISMILSGNFSMKNFLANKGKLVNGKVVPAEKKPKRMKANKTSNGIDVYHVDLENTSPFERNNKLMINKANFIQGAPEERAFRKNVAEEVNLF
jgi:hypothetical protein